MPLPLSKNQVRRLGDRLRDATDAEDDDRALLVSVLGAYDEALTVVEARLTRFGLRPTSRLKNSGTIIEKLRRDPRTKLASIQDLAGARIVLGPAAGRAEQDRVAEMVVEAFSETGRVRVIDRRAEPRHGYRAVHIVVEVEDLPVEIQLRTNLQHLWAQNFEKLADELGRGIRYGGRPERLDALLAQENTEGRLDALRSLADRVLGIALEVADLFDLVEREGDDVPAESQRAIADVVGRTLSTHVEAVRLFLSVVRRLAS